MICGNRLATHTPGVPSPGDSRRDGHHDLWEGAAQRPATHAGRGTGYIHRRLPEKVVRPALRPSPLCQPDGDGTGGFDYHRQEKTNRSYQNRYEEFRNWRKKFLKPSRRKKEAARPEEEKQEKAWQTLKRDIKSSADTIHRIDTGQCRGYSNALFVSSILNKVSTLANHGEVEIVRRAVDFISEYNARVKKPVITPETNSSNCRNWRNGCAKAESDAKPGKQRKCRSRAGHLYGTMGKTAFRSCLTGFPKTTDAKELKSSSSAGHPETRHGNGSSPPMPSVPPKRVLNLQNI